jgi:SAM-dependent methyltransferase
LIFATIRNSPHFGAFEGKVNAGQCRFGDLAILSLSSTARTVVLMDWISFYDSEHSLIYVNARHRDRHYHNIAGEICRLVPSPTAAVLDYGCGQATCADILAAACGHLTMVEPAPNVRAALKARYAGNSNISVLAADEATALPASSFDLIVMHSVAQYLSSNELTRLLAIFHKLLKADGLLILGDVIPPGFAALAAALSLLRFAAASGFIIAAVRSLMWILVSDYPRLKKTVGLSHYEEAAMLALLKAVGFSAARASRNIGHNQWRMSFLARPMR